MNTDVTPSSTSLTSNNNNHNTTTSIITSSNTSVNDNLMARARRVGIKIRSIPAINSICDTAFR